MEYCKLQYDCNNAPLISENVTYAWFNDKKGNKRDFYESWLANCKAVRAAQSIGRSLVGQYRDIHSFLTYLFWGYEIILYTFYIFIIEGVFSTKQDLPLTRLNFGGTSKGSAQLTVGRFECNGKVNVVGMPASCEDLWKIGNTMSGLYSIVGNKKVQSVYCNFNKRPNEIGIISFQKFILKSYFYFQIHLLTNYLIVINLSGFQKWIGYADVKSMPVYFYVTMDASFTKIKTPLPFKTARLNVGNAMNLSTGKFKAPRAGIYFLSFTGLAEFPLSSKFVKLAVGLVLNGDVIRNSYVSEQHTTADQSSPLTLQTTISLKSDDQIWLQIESISSGVKLYKNSYTHFTGFLLEEEIVVSL